MNLLDLLIYSNIRLNESSYKELTGCAPKMGSSIMNISDLEGSEIIKNLDQMFTRSTEYLRILMDKYRESNFIINSIDYKSIDINHNKPYGKIRTFKYKAKAKGKDQGYDTGLNIYQCIVISNKDLDDMILNNIIEEVSERTNDIQCQLLSRVNKDLNIFEEIKLKGVIIPSIMIPEVKELFFKVYGLLEKSPNKTKVDKWVINNLGYLTLELERAVKCTNDPSNQHEINLESIMKKGDFRIQSINNNSVEDYNNKINNEVRAQKMKSVELDDIQDLNKLNEKIKRLDDNKILCNDCSSQLVFSSPRMRMDKIYFTGDKEIFKLKEEPDEDVVRLVVDGAKGIADDLFDLIITVSDKISETKHNVDSLIPYISEIEFSINNQKYLIHVAEVSAKQITRNKLRVTVPAVILRECEGGISKERIGKAIDSKILNDSEEYIQQITEILKKSIGDNLFTDQ